MNRILLGALAGVAAGLTLDRPADGDGERVRAGVEGQR